MNQQNTRKILGVLVTIISIVITFCIWNISNYIKTLALHPSKWEEVSSFWINLGAFTLIFIAVFGVIGSWASIDSWVKGFFVSKEYNKLDEIQTSMIAYYNQQAIRKWSFNLLTLPQQNKPELVQFLVAVCERMEYFKLIDSHKIASRDFFDESQFTARLTISDLSFCYLGIIHLLPSNLQVVVKRRYDAYTKKFDPTTRISGLRFYIFFHELLTTLEIDYPKQTRMYVANAIIFSWILKGPQKLNPYQNLYVITYQGCNSIQYKNIEERLCYQLDNQTRRQFLDNSKEMFNHGYDLVESIYQLYSKHFFSQPII